MFVGNGQIRYGAFINAVINFLIIAGCWSFFFIVRPVNALMARYKAAPPEPETTRECPYCLSKVPKAATKCAFCVSSISPIA